MNVTLSHKKSELIAKREELLARLDAIKRDYGKGLEADSSEQAIQLENAEVLEEISRVTNEELQKVSMAIERLETEISRQA